jgi:hypothetical protein
LKIGKRNQGNVDSEIPIEISKVDAVKNDCLSAALQELSLAGIRHVERAYGSKHLQLRWRVNGTERMYSMPATPSDIRSASNTRAGIRRMLREDGLLITAERKHPAPKPPDRIALLERRIVVLEQRLAALEQK